MSAVAKHRWKRAWQDTLGFRNWKREIIAFISTLGGTWLTLRILGVNQGLIEEIAQLLVAGLIVVVLLPGLEFAWNYVQTPS